MEQKKSRFINLFPQSANARMLLGAWWIFEAIMIETPLFYLLTNPAEQQLLGPINVIYFLSSLAAVLYGTVCFGLGYFKWSRNKRVKKIL
jgi:hypothetical protein